MFEGWDNFYLMIGPAAAGLIGLLFIVVTLTAGLERSQSSNGQPLYLTPTALHFGVVLTISAIAMAPRLGPATVGIGIGLASLVGLVHAIRSCLGIRRLRHSTDNPHWSDLWCYGVVPTLVYFGLCGVTVALGLGDAWAPPALAALLLGLLLISIRNARDLVTFIAPMTRPGGSSPP
jgi:hypothetical protein